MSTATIAACLLAPAVATAASSRVAALQVALRAHGVYSGPVDGVTGPGTRAGVRRIQRRHRLAVDGIVGPRTRRALGRQGRHAYGSRPMRSGHRGWDVAALQFSLETRGFPNGGVDGGFGPRTAGAVRRAQTFYGLTADGVAGPATLSALSRAPVRAPGLQRPIDAPLGDRYGPAAPPSTPAWTSPPPRAPRSPPPPPAAWSSPATTTAGATRSRSTTATACARATPTSPRSRSRGRDRRRRRARRPRRRDRLGHRPAPALRGHDPQRQRGSRPSPRPLLTPRYLKRARPSRFAWLYSVGLKC